MYQGVHLAPAQSPWGAAERSRGELRPASRVDVIMAEEGLLLAWWEIQLGMPPQVLEEGGGPTLLCADYDEVDCIDRTGHLSPSRAPTERGETAPLFRAEINTSARSYHRAERLCGDSAQFPAEPAVGERP